MSKQLQWFPGHMFKSIREIKEKISMMDIVFVLLDARLPQSSMNPEIEKIIKQKPVLLLFNKMDLTDANQLKKWQQFYVNKGYFVLSIDAQKGTNVNKIYPLVKKILHQELLRRQNRGLKEVAFNTMILGIPNVGKSTLINKIVNKKSTKTANKPGVTRAQQWVKLGENFHLLDTPGILWPKFDDQKIGYHLAITGAIKDNILPVDDVVHYAISFLQQHYLSALKQRYDDTITKETAYLDCLHIIAHKRGAYLKQREVDYDRVYQIILTDIRSKQLGGISFDIL